MSQLISSAIDAERLIGGKWKMAILAALIEAHETSTDSDQSAALRFNELKRLIPELTQRMLSIQLKSLEADGLIERKVFAVVPPKVEYRLSDQGVQLNPLIKQLGAWAAGVSHS